MTANELADELGNILTFLEIEYENYEDDDILKQAATMLRQQDKEIKKLHKVANAQTEKMINLALELARAHRMIEKAREK